MLSFISIGRRSSNFTKLLSVSNLTYFSVNPDHCWCVPSPVVSVAGLPLVFECENDGTDSEPSEAGQCAAGQPARWHRALDDHSGHHHRTGLLLQVLILIALNMLYCDFISDSTTGLCRSQLITSSNASSHGRSVGEND